jgi:hypothetical protein
VSGKMPDYKRCHCHESAHAAGHHFAEDLVCDRCESTYWEFHANPQDCQSTRHRTHGRAWSGGDALRDLARAMNLKRSPGVDTAGIPVAEVLGASHPREGSGGG